MFRVGDGPDDIAYCVSTDGIRASEMGGDAKADSEGVALLRNSLRPLLDRVLELEEENAKLREEAFGMSEEYEPVMTARNAAEEALAQVDTWLIALAESADPYDLVGFISTRERAQPAIAAARERQEAAR